MKEWLKNEDNEIIWIPAHWIIMRLEKFSSVADTLYDSMEEKTILGICWWLYIGGHCFWHIFPKYLLPQEFRWKLLWNDGVNFTWLL